MQSNDLIEFYKAYAKWLQNPKGNIFVKKDGLCGNLMRWCDATGRSSKSLRELIEQFEKAGLNTAFPFNGDSNSYNHEQVNHECHLNQARIDWVFDHLRVI